MNVNLELDPKLLDVVEFEDSSVRPILKRTGTVVETFGEPPNAVLIEVADSQGLPVSFVTQKLKDVRRVHNVEDSAHDDATTEAQLHFEKGFLLLQNGSTARAKDEFLRAFSLEENLKANLLNATNVLAQKGKFDAAIRVYGLILEVRPDYELARQNLSATYVQRGIKQGQAGLLDQAIEDFNLAMALRPRPESIELIRKNLVAAYTQLGIRYSDAKQYQEAVSCFFVAHDLDPFDMTRKNIAIAMVSSSAANSAPDSQVPNAESFSQPIQMGLTFSECLNAYGATLARHGRRSEARFALQAAAEADPGNLLAKRNLDTISEEESPGDLPTGIMPSKPQEPDFPLVSA